ncbi:MAG: hypothetical protein LBT08_10820, partial [Synergistaceae bacterium]|nr:hypothetical protein [Synergistaceae bacterium]
MKLSIWTLANWLQKKDMTLQLAIWGGEPRVESVSLVSSFDSAIDCLQLWQADGGDVIASHALDRFTVYGQTLPTVHNALQEAFSYYNNWERNLLNYMIEGKSLQDMLDMAHQIFQRPMCIKSSSSWAFAITKDYDASVHPNWLVFQESITNRQANLNAVSAVSLDPYFRQVFAQKYPSIMHSPVFGGDVLHANVWLQDQRVCEIVAIDGGEPFNPGDPHLMHFFAKLLHRVIQANTTLYLSYSGLAAFFTDMLETGTYNELNLSAVLHKLNWQKQDELAVFCVEMTSGYDTPILSAMREKLTERFENGCAFTYQGRIVCIANVTKDGGYAVTQKSAAETIPGDIFIWGASFEFDGLENFPAYYQQAYAVLGCARKLNEAHLGMYDAAIPLFYGQ